MLALDMTDGTSWLKQSMEHVHRYPQIHRIWCLEGMNQDSVQTIQIGTGAYNKLKEDREPQRFFCPSADFAADGWES